MTHDELLLAAAQRKSVVGLSWRGRPSPAVWAINQPYQMVVRSLPHMKIYQRGTWKNPRPPKPQPKKQLLLTNGDQ